MRPVITLFASLALAAPALAQDPPAITEIRNHWQRCMDMVEAAPDEWVGWRRDFDNGYTDAFEFHDGGSGSVSVLVQSWMIDGTASQTDTSCYRSGGSLAFIFSQMIAPNIAAGSDGGLLHREGRIYFSPEGEVIRVLSHIIRDNKVVAAFDTDSYRLARGCDLTIGAHRLIVVIGQDRKDPV